MATSTELVVEAIANIGPDILLYEEKFRRLNLKADIEWNLREKLRTTQGLLSKVDDSLNEIIWSIGTDGAVAVAEEVWGPIEEVEE